MRPILIYCASKNRKFDDIAHEYGFRIGARLPNATVYHDLYFADQDWKKPDRDAYIRALERYRPEMATVLDLEKLDQLDEVMEWADKASRYVNKVLIIPKVSGIVGLIPRKINNADIVLAYSVPTKYGGTFVPSWEFAGWPVHLLGGNPNRQRELCHYMDVYSVDGNMALRMATKFCKSWVNGGWVQCYKGLHDVPYLAFELSCKNISEFWNESNT